MGHAVKKAAKRGLGAGITAAYNPIKGFKDAHEGIAKDMKDLMPKPPKFDDSAEQAAWERQNSEQAKLDEEENRRRKMLLSAAQGIRAYRGSPLFRAPASNTAGNAAPSVGGGRPMTPGRGGGGGGMGAGSRPRISQY